MKQFFLILFVIACSLPVVAQDAALAAEPAEARNMAFEFTAGYSVPLGIFASTDRSNDASGYALPGWHLQAAFSWLGKKDIGLALQYSYQRNGMDNGVNNIYPNGVPDSVDPGSWSNHYLLAGPVFMKSIKKWNIDAKLLGGFIVSAGSLYDTHNPANPNQASVDNNVASGFGMQVSAGAGYSIAPKLVFKFNLSFSAGWPGKEKEYASVLLGYEEKRDPETGLPIVVPIYSAHAEYDMKKTVLNLNPSIGIVYRF